MTMPVQTPQPAPAVHRTGEYVGPVTLADCARDLAEARHTRADRADRDRQEQNR